MTFFRRHRLAVLLILALLVQTAVYLFVGTKKAYFHMDEAYSFGLSNYSQVEIQDNPDFYNTWHDSSYYADYLQVDTDERWDFTPVYTNQRDDVHPPLYYLFLRLTMELTAGRITKWGGIALNILIFASITVFTFLIAKRLWPRTARGELIALLVSFVSSITLASLASVVYIRMYALSTLNILVITYLHLLLQDAYTRRHLILILLVALIGSLTHYFFLFYLGVLFILTLIKRLRTHQPFWGYVLAFVVAAVLSLLIFPHSITHLFFSHRGSGALSNLANPSALLQIGSFLWLVQTYVFNHLLVLLLLFMFIAFLVARRKRLSIPKLSPNFWLAFWPTLAYFFIVAIASPYIELRYIMPVCPLIFVLTFYFASNLVEPLLTASRSKAVLISTLALIAIVPIFTPIPPQQNLYLGYDSLISRVSKAHTLPMLYWFNSSHNRFLDDIYLFTLVDKSYVAKDQELTSANLEAVLADTDYSKGLIVIINEGFDHHEVLSKLINHTGLNSYSQLYHLNAADIYLISP